MVDTKTKKVILAVFFISGLVSLALEIVWFRMLSLFIPTTAYAFSVMLVAVLLGIASGSFVAGWLMRHKINIIAWLAVGEIAIAIAIQISLLALIFVYPSVQKLHYGNNLPTMIVVSFVAIFPTTWIMGLVFPLGIAVWQQQVGKFYATNVAGSILGAIVGGFWLLPRWGSQNSLIILSFASLFSGLILLKTWRLRLTILAVFTIIILLVPDFYSTVLRYRYPGEKLLWFKEGIQTTVSVQENKEDFRIMYMDGRHQADDSPPVVEVHRQIGKLPVTLRPDSRDALVIGLGGGVTSGEISLHPNINIDIVELSDTVIEGARWFNHVNNRILDQPNVHLIVDDGRNYLLQSRKKYDIITADIIQPNYAGAGNLYSKEYFELVKKSLKPGGIAVQWIGRRAASQYKAIMRTFLNVFPNATLWDEGIIMVGSQEPILNAPVTAEQMRKFVGHGPILTDNKPFVEYYFLALPRGEEEVVYPK